MKTDRFVLRRKTNESDQDKYIYLQKVGRDCDIVTPFIDKAYIYEWYEDTTKARGRAWRRHYITTLKINQ